MLEVEVVFVVINNEARIKRGALNSETGLAFTCLYMCISRTAMEST